MFSLTGTHTAMPAGNPERRMSLTVRTLPLTALMAVMLLAPMALAADSVKPFFGRYEGQSVSVDGGGVTKRDISVEIGAFENGFTLTWTALIPRANGSAARKSYTSNFKPTDNPTTFKAVQRRNMFGGMEPNDPLGGDPYVWARLKDDTLSVFALVIDEAGTYEVQVYDRTLTEKGLALAFSRYREGKLLRRVEGTLTRAE